MSRESGAELPFPRAIRSNIRDGRDNANFPLRSGTRECRRATDTIKGKTSQRRFLRHWTLLRVVWRCGLTNRSTAVADAEPPPPMVPVVNGGPSFGSTLATSRDFRFSSFKKADVEMCQAPFSPPSHHRLFALNTSPRITTPFPRFARRDIPGYVLYFRVCTFESGRYIDSLDLEGSSPRTVGRQIFSNCVYAVSV